MTPENSWYESYQVLFNQSPKYFESHAIRIISDKKKARYRFRHKPMPKKVKWPLKSTSELLGEALGTERFITSADHPLYRDLIDGVDLE